MPVDNLRIVWSASEKFDDTIYFGESNGIVERDTGAVFVLERSDNSSKDSEHRI
jgi:hypothetical protein